jgi:hypothetical protein
VAAVAVDVYLALVVLEVVLHLLLVALVLLEVRLHWHLLVVGALLQLLAVLVED